MKTTTTHWTDAARAAVTLAATRAGISLAGIEIHYADIERTWGDKAGLVVVGGDDATRARVATYLTAWLRKHLPRLLPRSYDTQTGVDSAPKSVGWMVHNGGQGVFPMTPPSFYTDDMRARYLARIRPALAIGCVYYPCAE